MPGVLKRVTQKVSYSEQRGGHLQSGLQPINKSSFKTEFKTPLLKSNSLQRLLIRAEKK